MKMIVADNQKTFFEAMSIRGQVFVDEQHVPSCLEIDDLDKTCLHVLLYDENDSPKAVLRLIEKEHYFKVGRVAVLKENRHLGYGKAIMQGIEQLGIVKQKGELRLDAQMSAVGFYEKLGYHLKGEPFIEANIWHRHAIKKLSK